MAVVSVFGATETAEHLPQLLDHQTVKPLGGLPGVPRVSQGRPLMKTWQYASLLWDRRTVFRRWNQQNQDYLLFIAR